MTFHFFVISFGQPGPNLISGNSNMGTDNNGIYFHFLFRFIYRGSMTNHIRLIINWLNLNLYCTTGSGVQ